MRLVTSTFKVGREELFHNGRCGGGINEASRHNKYVGIIVLTDEMSNLGYPTESGAYALVLVERHGNAFTATADGNARVAFAFLDSLGQWVRIVGIVAASCAVRAEVFVLPALGVEPLFYIFFQFVSSVVAGKTYSLHNLQIKGRPTLEGGSLVIKALLLLGCIRSLQ